MSEPSTETIIDNLYQRVDSSKEKSLPPEFPEVATGHSDNVYREWATTNANEHRRQDPQSIYQQTVISSRITDRYETLSQHIMDVDPVMQPFVVHRT